MNKPKIIGRDKYNLKQFININNKKEIIKNYNAIQKEYNKKILDLFNIHNDDIELILLTLNNRSKRSKEIVKIKNE